MPALAREPGMGVKTLFTIRACTALVLQLLVIFGFGCLSVEVSVTASLLCVCSYVVTVM